MAAAAPVTASWRDHRESEYHPQKIPISTTGSDERIATGVDNCIVLLLAGLKNPQRISDRVIDQPKKPLPVVDLFELIERTTVAYGTPPPSYDDATQDLPPDYTSTDSLAHVNVDLKHSAPPPIERDPTESSRRTILLDPTMSLEIDFGDLSGTQTRGKKAKAKQAAKAAQAAKWADSGDEGDNKAGGEDGQDGSGGNAGGGGGDGGGNDGGGDGNGDDDWNDFLGGKKNKKKKGKNNKTEEEEKKKEEEERKKQEEEAANADPLSWADEVADANPDDEWGGFTVAGKKSKKNKKGKNDEVPPPPPDPPTSAFQDISLDDGAPPQLDLNFDSGNKTKTDFGFGSFANNWNTGGSSWDFGNIGTAATTDVTDNKASKDAKVSKDLTDNNPWSSLGAKSKNKKKTTFSDFDFGDLTNEQNAGEENGGAANDEWGTFAPVSKKDAKKKKKNNGIIEEIQEPDPEPAPAVEVITQTPAEDTWDAWGTASKKKKGKKGAAAAAAEEPVPPPPPPAPAAPPDTEPVDEWAIGFGKKSKKKKNALADTFASLGDSAPDPTPAVPDPPPAAEPEIADVWTTGTGKKGKKKKNAFADVFASMDEPQAPAVPEHVPPPEPEPDAFDAWGTTTTKGKKSKKKGAEEELVPTPAPVPDVSAPGADDTLGASWISNGSSKKDKKKKKGILDEEVVPPPPSAAHEEPADKGIAAGGEDDWFGGFGTSKKDRKNKKKSSIFAALDEPTPAAITAPATEGLPTIVDDTLAADDFDWDSLTTKKKDKKGAKGIDKGDSIPDPPPPAPEPAKTDNWDVWGTTTGKNKKKGGKNVVEPDPLALVEPEAPIEEPAAVEESWGADTWGLSAKEKRKREKEAAKKKAAQPPEEPKPLVEPEQEPAPQQEEDTWGAWNISGKDKKKSKKGKQADEPPPPAPTPPAQGLTPEPTPPPIPELDEHDDGGWGVLAKSDSKTAKGKKAGTLSRTVTATSKTSKDSDTKLGLTKTKSKDKSPDIIDFGDDTMNDLLEPEPPAGLQEEKETPAKAVKSLWGSFGGTSTTTKAKTAKEKEREKLEKEKEKKAAEAKAAEEEAAKLLEELDDDDDVLEIVDEAPPKKGAKSSKTDSKLTKVDSKGSDKSNKSMDKKKKDASVTLLDIAEEPVVVEEKKAEKSGKLSASAKLKKAEAAKAEEKKAKEAEAEKERKEKEAQEKEKEEKEKEKEKKKEDSWSSMWGGASKKTAGQTKKEIKQQGLTNKNDALTDFAKDLEPALPLVADAAASSSATPKSSTMLSMSGTVKSKSIATKNSVVADRIKALEQTKSSSKDSARKKSLLSSDTLPEPEPGPEPEPAPEPAPEPSKEEKVSGSAKKASTLSKTKSNTVSKSTSKSTPASSKKKDPLEPPIVEEKKNSKDSVPGSFPEDDLLDFTDMAPSPEKPAKKGAKAAKTAKTAKAEPAVVKAPMPPTPPPEPVAEKPVKKERPKVVRDGANWGFWGPAPKKEVRKAAKAKDDSEASPPSAKKEKPIVLGRSPSTKSTKEKQKDPEKQEAASKSSGSEKTKRTSKPPVSRGMSFSAFMMGGSIPAKPQSRRSSIAGTSKPSSRRQSMDVDDIAMPTPPPDDAPEGNSKAAKLMGVSTPKTSKKSVAGVKPKAPAVPDPYPIDDDDMVMVNAIEDPVINAPIPKTSKSSRKEVGSKAKSKRESKLEKPDEDIVMVEAGPSTDAPEVTTGPDDLAFVDAPRPVPPKRASTTAKKSSGGGLGGLFSFGRPRRASDSNEPVRTRSVYRDLGDDRRVREVERKTRKPARADPDGDGFTTDAAPAGGETEPEDAEERRAERRAKRASRDAEVREAEERRARRREVERAKARESREKRAREEEEREERRREEKRARRAAREERLAREEEEQREAERRAAERRERRRTRDLTSPEPEPMRGSRRKSERHQSQYYARSGDEDLDLRPEKSSRRRSHAEKSGDERRHHHGDKSSRRKSGLGDEYLKSRSGNRAQPPILEHQPTDKTSSWVNSQADDPPEAPPIEPTIVDAPVVNGTGGYEDGLSAEEELRRGARHRAKRSSKYAGMTDQEIEDRRRRKEHRRAEKEQLRSSEGSDEHDRGLKRRSTYHDSGAERIIERTSLGGVGKRGSWLKKLSAF